MSYQNIVFAKLEKRLFSDHRWYMMSEQAQLNFIRFILFAAETYNKIPKNIEAIRLAFKTNQDLETIKATIKEIKTNFPKFKENKHFYYFDEFETKTNYIPKKDVPRKSRGLPKRVTDKDKEEDKEEDKDKDKKKQVFDFNSLYLNYPKRLGRKAAEVHFQASVKTEEDFVLINKALNNYKTYIQDKGIQEQFIKHASTWFNNWRDWIEMPVASDGIPESMRKWIKKE